VAQVHNGRFSADIADQDEVVFFLIGMRINHLWMVWKWLPVMSAMPKMLAELARDPSLGLLSRPRSFVSGRVIGTMQYWRSFADLERYARSTTHEHLPAWRAFNQKVRGNGAVGIFHETYRVSAGQVETMYANMPTFGLAGATKHSPAAKVGQTAATRIGARAQDTAPVEPY
jgi:hypothetical protein